MYAATEPYSDDEDQESSADVHADALRKHGKKFADQLRAGASKMHFPRDNHTTGGYDKLASRVSRSANPTHVTKGGKLTKTSQKGLKASMKEEATEDEFNKEIEDAKAKDAGKKKNTEIAKGAVQAVKNEETHTTVEFIDLNDVNGVRYSEIELAQERTLTPAETDKKEEIVKSMKKGLSGFKDRYGDRAKEVMYATATANAKNE
jgi:hypothetical protein